MLNNETHPADNIEMVVDDNGDGSNSASTGFYLIFIALSIFIACSSSVPGMMEDVGDAAADTERPTGGIGWILETPFCSIFRVF